MPMPHEIEELKSRIAVTEQEIKTLKEELKANTELTKEIKSDTEDLVAFVKTLAGFARFISWCGRIAAPIAAVGISVWATIKGLKQP